MDKPRLKRTIILKLLSRPSFLVPVVVGLSGALAGWAAGVDPSIVGFAGLAAIIVGAGALVCRAISSLDDLVREAYEEHAAMVVRAAERRLDALAKRLSKDDDPRDEQALAELRAVSAMLRDQVHGCTPENPTLPRTQLLEIAQKADRLFRSCLDSLEHSVRLLETSQMMRTAEAREAMLKQRELLLCEIQASAAHLGKVLDGLRSLVVRDVNTPALAMLRGELDESLAVARRVDERLAAMQSELDLEGYRVVEDTEPGVCLGAGHVTEPEEEHAATGASEDERCLDALAKRLSKDHDTRDDHALAELRAVYTMLQDHVRDHTQESTTLSRSQLIETVQRADGLFRSCMDSLEHSVRLLETSRTMCTADARKAALKQRELLLSEVRASVAHLGKVLDGLRLLVMPDVNARALAMLPGELDESLAVARRVEERLAVMRPESDLEGHRVAEDPQPGMEPE